MIRLARGILFICLLCAFQLDAPFYEERLQRIAQSQAMAAFQSEKNKDILSKEERSAIIESIRTGLPWNSVDPEDLEKGRYTDLDGEEALTLMDSKGEARLLDNDKDPVDARVVKDKKSRRFVIQWDEKSLKANLGAGKTAPDHFVRDVCHEIIRYAYHVGKIDRNDNERIFSGKLFIPPPDESIVLSSATYRMDLQRRNREIIPRYKELLHWLEKDLKHHKMAPLVIPGYKEDLALCERAIRSTITVDEKTAAVFDAVERSLIQQRATLIEQINLGHLPVEKPKDLKRTDFAARAAVLFQYANRMDTMIEWHDELRERKDAQDYLTKYGRLHVDYLRTFSRSQWDMTDEKLAEQFDGYERMFEDHLSRWRKEFRPLK